MRIPVCIFCVVACQLMLASDPGQWPKWRGPDDNGMARTDAPLHWTDTENIKWKATIPGRGHSSPVLWGDKIFLTTAGSQSVTIIDVQHLLNTVRTHQHPFVNDLSAAADYVSA